MKYMLLLNRIYTSKSANEPVVGLIEVIIAEMGVGLRCHSIRRF